MNRPENLTNNLKPPMKNIPSSLSLAKQVSAPTKMSAFTFALLLFSVISGFAQCGKDVILTSSKTEYLNAEGAVQRTVEEDCVIKIDKTGVTISPADKKSIAATVVSTTCEWKEPFKTGKTTVQVKFKDDDGAEKDATITVEGKDGKITCLMTQKEKPDRVIRVFADKFEEQKAAAKK